MIATGLGLGIVLGIVLQRGRFCVTGMLRDIFTRKTFRPFTALLIVISVQAIGVAALTAAGIITPKVSHFAPYAVIVGSFLFGIGIVLAGGCATGTWFRSGEGLVGSWLALVGYGVSAAAMKTGPLSSLNDALADRTINATTIPATLGISPWVFVIGLSALTAFLTAYFLKREKSRPIAQLQRHWSKRSLHLYTAAVLVGLIGVVAWPLSAATGRNSGLGITTPSADTVNYIATGNPESLNWGTLLVFGILIGAFAAAKFAGEFRVRVPDAVTSVRSVFGGLLMGIGASWAGGCTVGNGMVQTSLFSYKGWVALLFTAVGVYVAAKIWLKPTQNTDLDAELAELNAELDAELNAESDETVDSNVGTGTQVVNKRNDADSDTGLKLAVAASPVLLKTRPQVARAEGLREIAPGKFALDTLGAVCPFPLIDARAAMAQLEPGQTLVLDFDCTQATETIPEWAADEGYEISEFRATGDAGWTISVTK